MSSRRGRLNWSNLDIRISDRGIEDQHRFQARPSAPVPIEEETITKTAETTAAPTKRAWIPKKDAAVLKMDHFVGNYMLTTTEQSAIEEKYNNATKSVKRVETSPLPKTMRFSTRLIPSHPPKETLTRPTDLSIGQHLVNVFVCHVDTYSHIYIMLGDDYHRATKLFEEMNSCAELCQSNRTHLYRPKEKDLVAIYHEQKWFRGQCLDRINTTDFHVKCIDSGAVISSASHDLRRLPDAFRHVPPCCIECRMSGLPKTIDMDGISESIHSRCSDLLYKDRYEAVITEVTSNDPPTIVLYYGDANINDQLRAIL